MSSYPMRVIVAGAGIGGLCLANALHRAGADVRVYERDPAPFTRRQGYRLHLDEDGIDALMAVLTPGRWAAFRATAYEPRPRFVHLDARLGELGVLEHGGRHLSVDRRTLREALLAGVPGLVAYGRALTGFALDGERVIARFADGSTDTGDVLVGADGVNSAVRRQYLPHARVVGTGLCQLYGKIPLAEAAGLDAVFTAITGPGHRVVGVAPTRGYATCSFGARVEDLPPGVHLMSEERLRALVAGEVADWHPRVRRMISRWTEVFPLVLRTSVPIAPWPTSRVTLLGDAVHAMSPAGGVGANTALRDARMLAGALTGGEPLMPALRAYESEMIARGFAAVRESAANGARFLGQDPLPAGAAP
jgi:2-polyprenyl-6-methoxyphenol hydroxylase-like FAD-dependent oxidoreductase